MDTYTYNPLKEPRATRFVRVLPGTSGGIQCQLFRANLEERVEYIALSYAWGTTVKSKAITCNGRSLKVTDSLLSALLRLRLPDEPRIFWVDAICINQDDIAERNRQVALVREIYRKALKLFIWLGPGDRFSTTAVNLMRTFAVAQHTLTSAGVHQTLDVQLDQWAAFAKFLHRSWFERMWVIIELAMGLKLSGDEATVFLCGVHRFGLQELKSACEWCVQLIFKLDSRTIEGATMIDAQRGAKRVLVLCEMTHNRSSDEIRKGRWRQWLLSKVADTRDKKATDPRDRLFALYGFLNDGAEPVAVADYSKSVNQVFHEFALDSILQSRSLDIFSEAEEPVLRTMRNTPSWVPNWAASPARVPLLRVTANLGTSMPRNFARQACGATNGIIFSLSDHVLLIDGVCFDEIATVSKVLYRNNLGLVKNKENDACLLIDLWRDTVSHLDPYPRKTPAIEAYYKTLICGREEDDRQAQNFVTFWKSLHAFEAMDLPTFCISKQEVVQLLCRKPAGADIIAQIHEICSPLEGLELGSTKLETSTEHNSHIGIDAKDGSAPKDNTAMDGRGSKASRATLNSLFRHASSQRYRNLLLETANNRVLFTTKRGYMGLGVSGTETGDMVCVLSGGKIPFVLRKTGLADRRHMDRKAPRSPLSPLKSYSLIASLVGEAYVHGIMHGEALRKEGEVKWDRIALI